MYGKRTKREKEREKKLLQRAKYNSEKKKKRLKNTGETYSTSIHSETKF